MTKICHFWYLQAILNGDLKKVPITFQMDNSFQMDRLFVYKMVLIVKSTKKKCRNKMVPMQILVFKGSHWRPSWIPATTLLYLPPPTPSRNTSVCFNVILTQKASERHAPYIDSYIYTDIYSYLIRGHIVLMLLNTRKKYLGIFFDVLRNK